MGHDFYGYSVGTRHIYITVASKQILQEFHTSTDSGHLGHRALKIAGDFFVSGSYMYGVLQVDF